MKWKLSFQSLGIILYLEINRINCEFQSLPSLLIFSSTSISYKEKLFKSPIMVRYLKVFILFLLILAFICFWGYGVYALTLKYEVSKMAPKVKALPPSLVMWVQSQEPTWWTERNDSWKLSSLPHMCHGGWHTYMCIHTHIHNKCNFKINLNMLYISALLTLVMLWNFIRKILRRFLKFQNKLNCKFLYFLSVRCTWHTVLSFYCCWSGVLVAYQDLSSWTLETAVTLSLCLTWTFLLTS